MKKKIISIIMCILVLTTGIFSAKRENQFEPKLVREKAELGLFKNFVNLFGEFYSKEKLVVQDVERNEESDDESGIPDLEDDLVNDDGELSKLIQRNKQEEVLRKMILPFLDKKDRLNKFALLWKYFKILVDLEWDTYFKDLSKEEAEKLFISSAKKKLLFPFMKLFDNPKLTEEAVLKAIKAARSSGHYDIAKSLRIHKKLSEPILDEVIQGCFDDHKNPESHDILKKLSVHENISDKQVRDIFIVAASYHNMLHVIKHIINNEKITSQTIDSALKKGQKNFFKPNSIFLFLLFHKKCTPKICDDFIDWAIGCGVLLNQNDLLLNLIDSPHLTRNALKRIIAYKERIVRRKKEQRREELERNRGRKKDKKDLLIQAGINMAFDYHSFESKLDRKLTEKHKEALKAQKVVNQLAHITPLSIDEQNQLNEALNFIATFGILINQ